MTEILIILAVWLILAIICHGIAEKRNKNSTAWFIWGLAFGVLALGYLLMNLEE